MKFSNAEDCLVLNGSQALIQLFGRLTGSHMIGRLFTSVKVQAPPLQLLNSREALEKDGKFSTSESRCLACSRTVHRGGVVQDKCGELVNAEAARVVYKNNYSFGVKIFNIYMVRKPARAPYPKFWI
jgi:predicted nucleic acid-binding Zn ribbon protein